MSDSSRLTVFEFSRAAIIRIAIIYSSYRNTIADRVELSTPINSWKRILEGVYLYNQGVDPYTGDLFHESPVTLKFFQLFLTYFQSGVQFLFIGCDLLAAYLLYETAKTFIKNLVEQEVELEYTVAEKSRNLLITHTDTSKTAKYVLYAYLYNPYIILNCVAFTTTVFCNLYLSLMLYCLVNRYRVPCVVFLSFAILHSIYPLLLLVPVCLVFYNDTQSKRAILELLVLFGVVFSMLLAVCYYITTDWSFLYSTYGFALNVNDLKPNIGLFWYFFTEMFEHFRSLFICALQINATILYLVPLTIHLKKEPLFLAMILTALTAVFKSYPSLGDVGFYLALLPMWTHLFGFMHQGFVVGCILLITTILGPTVWHLWIYSGSANANFYFGVTLAFATAQIFLVTDLLFAHKKREFALKNGWPYDAAKSLLVLD